MKKRHLVGSLLLAAVVGFNGCKTIPPDSLSMCQKELRANDEYRRERASVLEMTLEEKIKLVEREIETNLVKLGKGLLLPLYSVSGKNSPSYLDNNLVLISALSAKYAVTKDPHTKEIADLIIQGIIEMDKLDGFDGYIPLEVDPASLKCTSEITHANSYDQLCFAYLHYTIKVGENPDIEKHFSKVYNMWADNKFELKDKLGNLSDRANLNINLFEANPSRALSRQVLDSVAARLGDEQTKRRALKNKWKGVTFSQLRFDLGFVQIPTVSSSWLNMLKLNILNECGQDYKKELVSLAKDYADMKNPFFQILAYTADKNVDLSFVEQRLHEYPYPINDRLVVNSHRKDIEFRSKRYFKNIARTEVKTALPLYEISTDYNLWKRNLLEADKQASKEGRKYFGVDLLQAYWFYEAIKKTK
ncbi:MAG: hypothetical protein WCI72_04620 [archaeon]